MKPITRTLIAAAALTCLASSPLALGAYIDPTGVLPNGDFSTGDLTHWDIERASPDVITDTVGMETSYVVRMLTSTGSSGYEAVTYATPIRLDHTLSYDLTFDLKQINAPHGVASLKLTETSSDTGGSTGYSGYIDYPDIAVEPPLDSSSYEQCRLRIGPDSDASADIHYTTGGAWGGYSYITLTFYNKADAGSGYWSWSAESRIDNVAITAVPEPATIALAIGGCLAMLMKHPRRAEG